MVGWKRRVVAFHEAAHAVVTVYFGLEVLRVTARWKEAVVPRQSAAWLARDSDASAQIEAYEKDAVIALAGLAAQRREYPDLTPDLDADIVLIHGDDDMHNAQSAIYKIVCLMNNKSFSSAPEVIKIDEPMQAAMRVVFDRLKRQTAALIEEHWPAVTRVAKALERHDLDQTGLDRLIKGSKRDAAQ